MERALLDACVGDYAGIWELLVIVRDYRPETQRKEFLSIVEHLLLEGLIEAGAPNRNGRGFDAWKSDPGKIIATIEQEWVNLGHDPYLGDIAWFNATKAGEDYLQRHTPSLAAGGESPGVT